MTDSRGLAEAAFEALKSGDPDAAAKFDRAIQADPDNASLILAESEALLIAGAPDPAWRLRTTLERYPEWAEGHSAMAAILWELGTTDSFADSFTSALRDNPRNPALWNAYLQTLAEVEDYHSAAAAAAEARRYFDSPVLTLVEASNRGLAGEAEEAEALIASVPPSLERDQVEVRHRIREGDLTAAAEIVERLIGAAAMDLRSWALAEVLWRKTSDKRWPWLAGSPQFIKKMRLPSTDDQLRELAENLEGLHRHQRQPIGQSVRGGTQTRGRLLDRRDATIVTLKEAFQSAVDAYRRRLPSDDERHPLLKHRNRALTVDGGWSVRLSSTGFHVSHLHPAGVLSSAFYVRVPKLDQSRMEGWLELGRPPPDLKMDLEPIEMIEPEPGYLVLFPSFLYHGTRRFPAGERMSVAFDVI